MSEGISLINNNGAEKRNGFLGLFLLRANILMEQGKNTSIMIAAVALIAGAVIGFYGSSFKTGVSSSFKEENEKLKSQIEAAKKFFPPSPPEIRSLSGTVKEIKDGAVTIEVNFFGNPFEDLPKMREVTVGERTIIVKNEQKSPDVFRKEMDAYQAALAKLSPAGTGPAGIPAKNYPIPPAPFIEKKLELAALKAGDQISVEAGENIKTMTRFEAIRIVVQTPVALPASAPAGALPPAGGPGPAGSAVPPK